MSKKEVLPTIAAIFRPRRSSTFLMPASFRTMIAPRTAVATPVTFSGTLSSNIFAASTNDMSIESTFPAANVLTSGAGGPAITLYSACQPRLPSRSSLWMISHAAQPSWRYAKRTFPFPWATVRRDGKPAVSAAPAATPARRKSRRFTSCPSGRIACPPCFRTHGVHQDERVHGHDPAARRDQGVQVQLRDLRVVREEIPDCDDDVGECRLVHGRCSAEAPEKRRPPSFSGHRACRAHRDRGKPHRDVAHDLGEDPTEPD